MDCIGIFEIFAELSRVFGDATIDFLVSPHWNYVITLFDCFTAILKKNHTRIDLGCHGLKTIWSDFSANYAWIYSLARCACC